MVENSSLAKQRESFVKAYKEKNFFRANFLGEELIELHKKNEKIDSYEYCVDLYNVAIFQQKVGNLFKACKFHNENIEFFTNIKKFKENSYSKDYAEVFVDTFTANGICLAKNQDLNMSLKNFEKAYKIATEHLKGTNKYLNSLHNLGCAYFNIEDYEKSIEILLKSLEYRQVKDIDYADTLNFLGYCYEEQKNYEKALYYFNKSILIIKGLEGISSNDYLANMYYLARVYEKAEDFENSIKYFEKSLCLIEKKFGEKSSYVAETLNKIANIYIKLKEEDKAIEIIQKSLKLIRSSYGENHIFYASTLKKLADTYFDIKDYKNALSYYEEESKIKKKIIGKDSSLYIDTLLNLVSANLKLNNTEKVDEICNEIFNLTNLNVKDEVYEKSLLLLAKILCTDEKSSKIFEIYENIKKINPTLTFDEMLENINQVKGNVAQDVYISNEQDIPNYSAEKEILKDLKRLLEKSLSTFDKHKVENEELEQDNHQTKIEELSNKIIEKIEKLGEIKEIEEFDELSEIDELKEVEELDEFSELDELSQNLDLDIDIKSKRINLDEKSYVQESILDLFSYMDKDDDDDAFV